MESAARVIQRAWLRQTAQWERAAMATRLQAWARGAAARRRCQALRASFQADVERQRSAQTRATQHKRLVRAHGESVRQQRRAWDERVVRGAATRIQACVRGAAGYREGQRRRRELRIAKKHALALQRWFRGWQCRKAMAVAMAAYRVVGVGATRSWSARLAHKAQQQEQQSAASPRSCIGQPARLRLLDSRMTPDEAEESLRRQAAADASRYLLVLSGSAAVDAEERARLMERFSHGGLAARRRAAREGGVALHSLGQPRVVVQHMAEVPASVPPSLDAQVAFAEAGERLGRRRAAPASASAEEQPEEVGGAEGEEEEEDVAAARRAAERELERQAMQRLALASAAADGEWVFRAPPKRPPGRAHAGVRRHSAGTFGARVERLYAFARRGDADGAAMAAGLGPGPGPAFGGV